MNNKQKLPISILMMAVGIVIFFWILIRFFNQGYFWGEPRVLYNFPFEMRDWFGTIFYSFAFALSGYFILRNRSYSFFICQFVIVGIILDRIWNVLERVNNVDALQSFVPMLLALLSILYLISNQSGFKEYFKKIIIIISLNIAFLGLGKFLI